MMSGEGVRRPDGVLQAFNPRDGQFIPVFVRESKAEVVRRRGVGPARELGECVPPTLSLPHAVFRGLRDQDEEEGLCYVGHPDRSFDYKSGNRVPPPAGEVFLVFVNEQRIVYTWGWERMSPDNAELPEGYATRFKERLV